jgi:hypothetical protein
VAIRSAAAAVYVHGTALLRDDFLRSSAYALPTDLQIVRASYAASADEEQWPNHSTAYVIVRYRLGGKVVEQSIQVNRDRSGPVRRRILGEGATVVPPGVYTVAASDTQVRTRVDECAKRENLSLVDCPFDRSGGSYTGTVTSVRWTIRRYLTIRLTASSSPTRAARSPSWTRRLPALRAVGLPASECGPQGRFVVARQMRPSPDHKPPDHNELFAVTSRTV